MSVDVASEAAAAALVDAARRREPGAAQPRPASRRGRVRTVDFTRPAKFSSNQERRMGRFLETFCRTASTRLAAELRMAVELDLIDLAQLTWATAHAQLPDGAICASLTSRSAKGQMLLAAELPLVLSAIERLLGGAASAPPPERKLTEIDAVVAQLFFTRLLGQLSAVLNEAVPLELELRAIEGKTDCEQLAGVSEPTLAATIEVRHERSSSTLALLLPHAAFAPIAEAFAGGSADGDVDAVDPQLVRTAVAAVDVVVHAEVAALDVPVETVLAVRPGDVLRLNAPAAAGVVLTVGGVEIARGAPGRLGSRRAVQVAGR